ncbi:MAG: lytic transglycosylase domain-containing protein [Afipia felis]|nr:lytic transglycosylase domain-containing protein [Afipia felis]
MAIDSTTASSVIDSARAKIAGAIKQAADATGASFDYLISTAKIESNLDPSAKASTSSARGLYQFIEQTWLGTVKQAGAAFGYGNYANAISQSPSGTYSVNDPATRDQILKLRDDPAANAAMAGALTQANSFKLSGELGRRPTDGELYMAHFMGAGGAARLISTAQSNPSVSAPAMFPNAAAANRSIFYNRDGSARSVSEVYSDIDSRFARAANSPMARFAVASAGGSSPAMDNMAYLSGFPQGSSASAATRQMGPTFHSLFQAGDRAEPLSLTVRQLWGAGSQANAEAAAAANPDQSQFNLFSDPKGTFAG